MQARWLWWGLMALLLVGCGRVQNPRFAATPGTAPDAVQIEVTVDEEALQVGEPAEVDIQLQAGGDPVVAERVIVEGTMSHAGMEPLFVTAEGDEVPGHYRALLPWTMGGEWIVTVRATLPDGSTVERAIEGLNVAAE